MMTHIRLTFMLFLVAVFSAVIADEVEAQRILAPQRPNQTSSAVRIVRRTPQPDPTPEIRSPYSRTRSGVRPPCWRGRFFPYSRPLYPYFPISTFEYDDADLDPYVSPSPLTEPSPPVWDEQAARREHLLTIRRKRAEQTRAKRAERIANAKRKRLGDVDLPEPAPADDDAQPDAADDQPDNGNRPAAETVPDQSDDEPTTEIDSEPAKVLTLGNTKTRATRTDSGIPTRS